MPYRTTLKLMATLIGIALCTPELLAYEYHGYLLGGGYIAREEFTTETAGVTNNDRAIASARLTLDVTKIASSQYQMFVDFHRLSFLC
jgi:hypothetical protein